MNKILRQGKHATKRTWKLLPSEVRKEEMFGRLRGEEGRDVWKALGKDGLVYHTVDDS
jgi:hypothetical protein